MRGSLRARLALSFAGIALLAALAIGMVSIPILAGHYATAEGTYLEAAGERAVRDLSVVDWSDRRALATSVSALAIVTQGRVVVRDTAGAELASAGPPAPGEPRADLQPLANPLGVSLFGDSPDPAALPRSNREVDRPVRLRGASSSTTLGTVVISQVPAYEQVALWTVAEAWALASLVGVAAAALVGRWASGRLIRPIEALTAASDRMADGDLSARADVRGEDEIGRLAASFNVMADRVDTTVATVRRFAGDAAHEMGTPLTALEADLELAEARTADADQRRLIGRARGQARRLERLGASLLRLSRLEGGAMVPSLEPVDLVAIAAQVVDAHASRADQADVELLLVRPSRAVMVEGDREALAIALGNLVDNALKFSDAGGSVTVEVAREGSDAVARVRDTGIGIAADDLPRLFERFHRGRNAAGRTGSGLGLAIVKATIELHGGRVRATSDTTGTCVGFALPHA